MMTKTKKLFALLLALTILLLTSTVFATNELQASMNKAGGNVKNAVEGAGNVIKDGASAVGTGVKDLGESARNGINNVEHGASDVMGRMTTTNNNNGYTATRTATNGTFMGMSGSTWTWFILAIAALGIIGIVWYYAMQNSKEYHEHHNH